MSGVLDPGEQGPNAAAAQDLFNTELHTNGEVWQGHQRHAGAQHCGQDLVPG